MKINLKFHNEVGVSLPYPDISKSLRQLKLNGYRYIQFDGRFMQRLDTSQLTNIPPFVDSYGLKSHSMHSYGDPLKNIQMCSLLKANILIVHPHMGKGKDRYKRFEDFRSHNVNRWKRVCRYAEKKGIKITIENIYDPEAFGATSKDLLKIIKDVDCSNFGICIDTGHANLQIGTSPGKAIMEAGRFLLTTHLNDNFGEKDEHLPPGKGNIDWKIIIRALKESRYANPFMIELPQPIYFNIRPFEPRIELQESILNLKRLLIKYWF